MSRMGCRVILASSASTGKRPVAPHSLGVPLPYATSVAGRILLSHYSTFEWTNRDELAVPSGNYFFVHY